MAKRLQWEVSDEIDRIEGKVPENLWRELRSVSRTFQASRDNHHITFFWKKDEKWQKIFLGDMFKRAKTFSHFKALAEPHMKLREKLPQKWEKVINKLYNICTELDEKKGASVYRWKELRRVCPKGHPMKARAAKRVKEISLEKKKKATMA